MMGIQQHDQTNPLKCLVLFTRAHNHQNILNYIINNFII